ncbi:vitamin B6 transporter TPN1 [Purpureocillium lavendulum]|uniref:Vitamin B6 transporter TPN1 n=1 Tax=Purpureocillium lavendulum TaxID=1247861 RepID=A0AB34FSG0_9HYPO|nr:vitamin B6 transporter TPN1 [Purpureocillium lavendulum]
MPSNQTQNGFQSAKGGYVRLSEQPGVKQMPAPQAGSSSVSPSRDRHDENMSRVKEALAGKGSLQFH